MPMLDSFLATTAMTRNQLLKLVADLSDDQLVLQPAPGVNHPAWVLGHSVLSDYNLYWIISGKNAPTWIDDAYKATYGGKSTPVADKSKYLPKQTYIERLTEARELVVAHLKQMKPDDFQTPHPDPARRDRFPTVGHAVMLYGTYHEAYHAGQISAWRRVLGLPPV
jgi:uncharacterized damage-inducible protein DinB